MSVPTEARPGKLVIGLFLHNRLLLPAVVSDLKACCGSIDMISPWFRFDFTSYYDDEMGTPLHRRLLIFRDLLPQDRLAEIKLKTNDVEACHTRDNKRQVNIDPGYLVYERFVLATGKNFTHRIYIGNRIYADLTLIYQKGDFQTLPWTFPDYADRQMRTFLKGVRQKYASDLKLLKHHRSTQP